MSLTLCHKCDAGTQIQNNSHRSLTFYSHSFESGEMCASFSKHKFTAGYCKESIFKKRPWLCRIDVTVISAQVWNLKLFMIWFYYFILFLHYGTFIEVRCWTTEEALWFERATYKKGRFSLAPQTQNNIITQISIGIFICILSFILFCYPPTLSATLRKLMVLETSVINFWAAFI